MTTGNQEKAKPVTTTAAPADPLATTAGLLEFISARTNYLNAHPHSRKDRIDSAVARALNSRKVLAPVGMPYWTGPDVVAFRQKHASK